MGERGQVVDKSGTKVKVRMTRHEACSKCNACITGHSSAEMFIEAKNICGANIDDWVNIELSGKVFLQATLIMYGVPFVFLLSGFITGYYTASAFELTAVAEIVGFVSGLLLMLISYFLIQRCEDKWQNGGFTPVATEVCS